MKHFSLEDRYTLEEGRIILTGVQALVRIPLDQHRADQRAGLNTATFISGYRGSPLGGYDMQLMRAKHLLDQHQVVFEPGVNEDIAATAVMGSQTVHELPNPKYDGVLGVWYGKGPGVDRSGDIFKHAQTTGVGHNGGVLAIAGDDPTAKSSTIPSHSEVALYDAQMPILYPANVEEIIKFGRYGFELSRFSGSWVGMKIVTNTADSYSTAYVSPQTFVKPAFTYLGRPWRHTQTARLLAPATVNQEREIHEARLDAAKAFQRANPLNRIPVRSNADRFGIVATGKTYYDVREALNGFGLDDAALNQYGIRLLKIGMLYPLDEAITREFAQGLQDIFVIEEKRGLLELFLRDALYSLPDRPNMVGKRDEHGQILVPGHDELDADRITHLLAQRLRGIVPNELIEKRLADYAKPDAPIILPMIGKTGAVRTPHFCSGCPHNRSTLLPEGAVVGGGIGCHSLVVLLDRGVTQLTQMGGEGGQWVGQSPFTETEHIFQNIGDGTLVHSGSLAVRQAISAGVNVTFKLLYNAGVAMTGGQEAETEMDVPALTHFFYAEGTKKVIVVADDPHKYGDNVSWARDTEVWHRDRMIEAQEKLAEIEGVTAVIYDQECATNLRRKRKRGLAPEPETRVYINEAVCEGCGDCGEKSNCLSVFPVDTEFGRKTQIHQASCNKDMTCLDGDCPAFIKVKPGDTTAMKAKYAKRPFVDNDLPMPELKVPEHAHIYMMGIGGTGVVTTSLVVSTAAMLAGKTVRSLDKTGLSQKGGPVVSNIKISDADIPESCAMGAASVDAFIVFDMLSATTDVNLSKAHPDKTIAVVSDSRTPTGNMVNSVATEYPEFDMMDRRLRLYTRQDETVYLDAVGLSEQLFGSNMMGNLLAVGAAYQAGAIPIDAEFIEKAIEVNGVQVEANQQAFRVGRLWVTDPERVREMITVVNGASTAEEQAPELTAAERQMVASVGAPAELERLLNIRVPELVAYQSQAYAQQYIDFVSKVWTAEKALNAGAALSEGVARYLFKLMAYKDEYEVARLHLKANLGETLAAEFGQGADFWYQLHPPILRALGVKKKLNFGKWFDSGYWLLTKMKGLRGTPFDIFGYDEVRKVERALIGEYKGLIEERLASLSTATLPRAIEIANSPDVIRGYENVKLRNVEAWRSGLQMKISAAGD